MVNLVNLPMPHKQEQPTAQPPQQMMMMRGGNLSTVPQIQNQQDPLGSAFMNMVQQQRGTQPQPGSLGAQFQLGKDYQNLGMDFRNAFSQNPQNVNPLAALFIQNSPQSPQFNSFQNVMSSQQQAKPPMGSIMGVGAQQPQGGGFLGRGIFGGLF